MATTKVLLNFSWSKSKPESAKHKKESKISESALQLAKSELREDKKTREQSLVQMREWLKKNYDVENVRTDDTFLLRFLRNKKFSVPMAQQQLLKYLNMRRVMGHLAYNLDFLSPGVKNLIDNGYIMISPIRDICGRRTVLYFANGLNGVEYEYSDQVKAHSIAYEILMESQEEQILGVVHIGDFAGASTSHVSIWKNPLEFLKILKWGEQSIPLRHKEIHLYHISPLLKYVVDAGKSIISSKMKERVHVHVTAEDLKKEINSKDVLPSELGGKVPMAEMIQLFKSELTSSRNTLLSLDKMQILNDAGIIGRRNCNKNNNTVSASSDQVVGSFRKLEFD
ncbi:CLUMA_CG006258, isoform A [Clunio marinus]|uniref:CLUMA_CG006258, isoform A n=1 Tax=Clunio marinus TaxID=568069 RepID=A0A1J1HZN0_9DIPT|nr:CLUMA_CG006258, isoform A [Clunio marinus]